MSYFEFFIFVLGLIIGLITAYLISLKFLLKNYQIENSRIHEAEGVFPYAVSEVWEFLTNEKLISCYKAYSFDNEQLEKARDAKSLNTAPLSLKDSKAHGDQVYINKIIKHQCFEYGQSPYTSNHCFKLYPINDNETLIYLKRIIRPQIEWNQSFWAILINSLRNENIPRDSNYAQDTLDWMRSSLNRRS